MKRIALLVVAAVAVFGVASVASAAGPWGYHGGHSHHPHSGGHAVYHNGHVDIIRPHGGHVHVDHYVPHYGHVDVYRETYPRYRSYSYPRYNSYYGSGLRFGISTPRGSFYYGR